jgi:hypothetical protein
MFKVKRLFTKVKPILKSERALHKDYDHKNPATAKKKKKKSGKERYGKKERKSESSSLTGLGARRNDWL